MSASDPIYSLDRFLDTFVLRCVRWAKRVYRAATAPPPIKLSHADIDDLIDWAIQRPIHGCGLGRPDESFPKRGPVIILPAAQPKGTGLFPTYFVGHSDGSYSKADPQPTLDLFGRGLPMKETENRQLKFLLSQAPMIDAPVDLFNAGRAVTKYAYVNPKTFAKFTKGAYAPKGSAPFIQVRPSSTKWVITSLMPEGTVLYTPNSLPGIEKLLAS